MHCKQSAAVVGRTPGNAIMPLCPRGDTQWGPSGTQYYVLVYYRVHSDIETAWPACEDCWYKQATKVGWWLSISNSRVPDQTTCPLGIINSVVRSPPSKHVHGPGRLTPFACCSSTAAHAVRLVPQDHGIRTRLRFLDPWMPRSPQSFAKMHFLSSYFNLVRARL